MMQCDNVTRLWGFVVAAVDPNCISVIDYDI